MRSRSFLSPIVAQRVLVIPPRFIGDVVVLTGWLRVLHQALPHLQLLVYAPEASIPLLQGLPFIESLIPAQKHSRHLQSILKTHHIDTAVLLRFSLSDAFTLWRSGVRHRVGFAYQRLAKTCYLPTALGLTHALPYTGWAKHNQQHHLAYLAQLLQVFGVTPPETITSLAPRLAPLSPAEAEQAQHLKAQAFTLQGIEANTPYSVLHLAASSAEKSVRPDQVLPVLQEVLQHTPQAVVCTGLAEHRALYEDLRMALPTVYQHWLVNLAGQGNLRCLQAWLTQAEALLSLDSAPVHMAAAVGTPKIMTWFGAVPSRLWQAIPAHPHQRHQAVETLPACKPCLAKQCSHNACKTGMTGLQGVQAYRNL
ncbi:MAG: glycosyltransferase family 9 protein [Vampirovibrionales bacterium]